MKTFDEFKSHLKFVNETTFQPWYLAMKEDYSVYRGYFGEKEELYSCEVDSKKLVYARPEDYDYCLQQFSDTLKVFTFLKENEINVEMIYEKDSKLKSLTFDATQAAGMLSLFKDKSIKLQSIIQFKGQEPEVGLHILGYKIRYKEMNE
jgi:hypothetical protein